MFALFEVAFKQSNNFIAFSDRHSAKISFGYNKLEVDSTHGKNGETPE